MPLLLAVQDHSLLSAPSQLSCLCSLLDTSFATRLRHLPAPLHLPAVTFLCCMSFRGLLESRNVLLGPSRQVFWRRAAAGFYLTSAPRSLLPAPAEDPAPPILLPCQPEPAWHPRSAACHRSSIPHPAATETAAGTINARSRCSASGGPGRPRIWLDPYRALLRGVLAAHSPGAAPPPGTSPAELAMGGGTPGHRQAPPRHPSVALGRASSTTSY